MAAKTKEGFEILGVPFREFALASALVLLITAAAFYPALSDFGHSAFGTEDFNAFVWFFWHYEKSLDALQNPLFAPEVFAPYGISLGLAASSPIQSVLYWALPRAWGVFGRITMIQIIPFLLGGVFSFALAYRYAKSFIPSFIAAIIYDFSVYHFHSALEHMQYNAAFAFLPLFFLFYLELAETGNRGRKLIGLLALSLLLVTLSEIVMALMLAFLVFLDMFRRYAEYSKAEIFTVRNLLFFGAAVFVSLVAFEILTRLPLNPAIVYVAPGLIFPAVCVFAVLGVSRALEAERKIGLVASVSLAALPAIAYVSLLLLLPSYQFIPDSILGNTAAFAVPLEYLAIPSDLQALAHTGLFRGLAAYNEVGVYLGLPLLALVALSLLVRGASKEEAYFRDNFIISLMFSFPILAAGGALLMFTPFLAEPLFPLLGLLRVPARFVILATLFVSVMAAIALKRLLEPLGRTGIALALVFALVLLAERWPALEGFRFSPNVPQFYLELANGSSNGSIFLYPNFDLHNINGEMYYQTIHRRSLSYGITSRFPQGFNALFALYNRNAFVGGGGADVSGVPPLVRELGYGYVVVQKRHCTGEGCYYGHGANWTADVGLPHIEKGLVSAFGNPIYEDEAIIVYRNAQAPG